METAKIFIKNLVADSPAKNMLFKRNLIKEYLQILVLDFLYSHPKYSQLVFYGGSCLAHCFGLPRLSEDLDFVDLKGKINLEMLARDLEFFFQKNTDLNLRAATQKFRIYLKFPLLWEIGLAKKNESNLLFLKVEVFKDFVFCRHYQTEIIPLFKFNKSILIRTFNLPTLMATKIRAVLYRKWVKKNRKGEDIIRVKGRDYFDLMWYLEKNIKPNLKCLDKLATGGELKKELSGLIAKVDARSIQMDLESLLEDSRFAKNLGHNIKAILKRLIETKLL